jgi:hypothetical protein
MEKKNREQRRREKFGHAGGATKEPWPQSEANPAFGHGGPPDEDVDPSDGAESADTGDPEKDVTKPVKPTKPASVGRRKKA